MLEWPRLSYSIAYGHQDNFDDYHHMKLDEEVASDPFISKLNMFILHQIFETCIYFAIAFSEK